MSSNFPDFSFKEARGGRVCVLEGLKDVVTYAKIPPPKMVNPRYIYNWEGRRRSTEQENKNSRIPCMW